MTDPAGVYTLADGVHTVDPVTWIVDVLTTEWDASHTDGYTPNVASSEEHRSVDFDDADYVTIYQTSMVNRPRLIGHTHRDVDYRLTLDFFTSVSRKHLFKIVKGAEVVLDGHRGNVFGTPDETNLTGRWWMEFGTSSTAVSRTAGQKWKMSVDVEIHGRAIEVSVP